MRTAGKSLVALVLIIIAFFSGIIVLHYGVINAPRNSAALVYKPYIPNDNQSVVVICFDDGWKSQLNASEILDAFGFKATYGIVTSYVDGQYPAYMSWQDVKNLELKGDDIESHSYLHLDLNHVSNEDLLRETHQSKEDLYSQVSVNASIFIYPFGVGYDNTTVRAELEKDYQVARALEDEDYVEMDNLTRWSLPAFAILGNTTLDDFMNIVDIAGGTTVAILVYHQIGETGDYSISKADFMTQMAYLKTENFTVMTMRQLFFEPR